MSDYYVRTKQGEFRDDRHAFTEKWTGVKAGELSSTHFDNPNLEIRTSSEHKKDTSKKSSEAEG